MENQAQEPGRRGRTKGAADLCAQFMENSGWQGLFDIAEGKPVRRLIKSRFTQKQIEVLASPEIADRLTAFRLICAYGYGRPREQLDLTSNGRTITDLVLSAVRQRTSDDVPAAGAE